MGTDTRIRCQVQSCPSLPSSFRPPERAAASATRTTKSRSRRWLGERCGCTLAEKFLNRDDVKQMILVISPEDREDFEFKFAGNVAILGIDVVEGGEERADSVEKAMARVKPDIDYVAVHDAARPCMVDEWITAVFEAAEKHEAAILRFR